MKLVGKVSWFGGPDDEGVAPDEGLAFIYDVEDAPQLFLPEQPEDTTGLARRLDPEKYYVACRWDYDETPKEMLLNEMALVRSTKTGKMRRAYPADWGPHQNTGRVADISPGLMQRLGIETDDEVEVIFPAREAHMARGNSAPLWLEVMRAITGAMEGGGSADNPKIVGMADVIARVYPDMEWYCDLYVHDDTPWCGLCAAFCMTVAGIRPPFLDQPAADTERWMWALAWSDDPKFGEVLDEPRPGCVVVMEREGGGHVTFYERTEGDHYVCRGGNQSDSVNEAKYAIDTVVALIWPRQEPRSFRR